ncbi:MAG: cyclase family protein [Peptococcaceae bacterium]|nr:cyclase family protein [Peptococcaceae bacterium]
MRIVDISMTIELDMAVYKNKPEKRPRLTVTQDFSKATTYESSIHMDMHCGTHLDAPRHVTVDGATVESQSLDQVVTKCKVLDLTHLTAKITRADLATAQIVAGDFLLLKTQNSYSDSFRPDFIYLDADGAQYLSEKQVKGVGIDALGVERGQPTHPTHHILLDQGISILEGLRLKEVDAGEYFLCAAPLKIKGAEAAPTRAILIAE